MGRRYSTHGIAKDRVYDVQTAARIIGVSIGTFRKFPARGLKLVSTTRPILVRGEHLIEFLKEQAGANKQPCRPEQFFCMSCKAPRDALGRTADYIPNNTHTGRLQALCSVCESTVSKFSNPAKVRALKGALDILISGSV